MFLQMRQTITIQELDSAIKGLGRDKAAGHDNIVNEFIIKAPLNVKLAILSVFNNIL